MLFTAPLLFHHFESRAAHTFFLYYDTVTRDKEEMFLIRKQILH